MNPPMRALACLSGWHLRRRHQRKREGSRISRAFLRFHGAVSSVADTPHPSKRIPLCSKGIPAQGSEIPGSQVTSLV